MTHEFKNIIDQALKNKQKGLKSVLATVVALDGSSYRKPGVRMLIASDGSMTGAISGGCVEKEVRRRAQTVLEDDRPKMITYDGRYRLGCEGILHILVEPFLATEESVEQFKQQLERREPFTIVSYFEKGDELYGDFGSEVVLTSGRYYFNPAFAKAKESSLQIFEQQVEPAFRLLIIGAEHDAVKLCAMAAMLGWEVEVVSGIKDPKSLADFPGAKAVHASTPELFSFNTVDEQTAVILMTHNYALDLAYVLKLINKKIAYMGILGAAQRREQLFNAIIEYAPQLDDAFLDQIYSPAGLNLGAVTAEEIALSILSEILALTRDKQAFPLREINGKIHL